MEKEENKQVGACGGTIIDSENKFTSCGGNLPSITEIFWKFGLRYFFKKEYLKYKLTLTASDCLTDNIGYIVGADIFFRKSVLDEVGLFDETFFLYYEETDLCKRIKDHNYTIKLVKDAIIKHLEGLSCKNKLLIKKRTKKSEFLYFAKHNKRLICFIKFLYIILYLFNWIIIRDKDSKELLKFIITNEQLD